MKLGRNHDATRCPGLVRQRIDHDVIHPGASLHTSHVLVPHYLHAHGLAVDFRGLGRVHVRHAAEVERTTQLLP